MLRQDAELRRLVENGAQLAHLKIGECVICREPYLISTVLGSCVSATFFHPQTRTGAMFHAMLPRKEGKVSPSGPCNFADQAVDSVVERFIRLGLRLSQVEVKLFGGANTMRIKERERLGEILDVGRKNADQALASLARHGLVPSVRDVYGNRGRKVLFNVGSGEVWVRFVDAAGSNEPVMKY